MVVYATLVICATLVGLLIYRYDMYEKESWYMMAATAAIGAAVMRLLSYVENISLRLLELPVDVVIAAVAATHEEFAKLGIVLVIATGVPKHFNDPMDGIIYGSIAGLGMAVMESLFYLSLSNPQGLLLPPSEVVRLFSHPLMGGICGFAIGMKRMRMRRWFITLVGCMGISVTIHFIWDWIAFSARSQGAMRWWQTMASILLALGGTLVYGALVVIGSDWSRQMFAPGSRCSLWGWPFSLLIERSRVQPATDAAPSPKSQHRTGNRNRKTI